MLACAREAAIPPPPTHTHTMRAKSTRTHLHAAERVLHPARPQEGIKVLKRRRRPHARHHARAPLAQLHHPLPRRVRRRRRRVAADRRCRCRCRRFLCRRGVAALWLGRLWTSDCTARPTLDAPCKTLVPAAARCAHSTIPGQTLPARAVLHPNRRGQPPTSLPPPPAPHLRLEQLLKPLPCLEPRGGVGLHRRVAHRAAERVALCLGELGGG